MNIIIVTILYFISVIFKLSLVNYFIESKKKKNEVKEKSISQNQQEIDSFICEEIKKRVAKLQEMSFKDWIKYNHENIIIYYKKQPLYLFISEKTKEKGEDHFILRVSSFKDYVNMNAKEQEINIKNNSSFLNDHPFPISPFKDIYYLNEWSNGCSVYNFLSTDNVNHDEAILKRALSQVYKKNENGNFITGTISLGYTILDINEQSYSYFSEVGNSFLILLYTFIYIFCIINYYFCNKNIYKTIFLLVVLNVYCTYFMLTSDVIRNLPYEQKMIDGLNSSILSISFLFGVNIFIIQSIEKLKTKYQNLYNESAFLFCASIISLMISIFQMNDFKNATTLKVQRIENQLFFNLSIIFNIFIIINFFIFLNNSKAQMFVSEIKKSFSSFLRF